MTRIALDNSIQDEKNGAFPKAGEAAAAIARDIKSEPVKNIWNTISIAEPKQRYELLVQGAKQLGYQDWSPNPRNRRANSRRHSEKFLF